MHGRRAICHSRNALCPATTLSRLFNIPLARHSPTLKFSTQRPGDGDDQALPVNTSSLTGTLDAHRRANRDSLVHKVSASADENTYIFRPALPVARFDNPIPKPASNTQDGVTLQNDTGELKIRYKLPGIRKGRRPLQLSPVPASHVAAKQRGEPPHDYVGQYVEPLYDREGVKDEDLPWFSDCRLTGATALERLSAELKAFHKYLVPTPLESAGRLLVIRDVLTHFSRYKARRESAFELELFGSQRTGLELITSDLDLRLHNIAQKGANQKKAPRYLIRKATHDCLNQVHAQFQKNDRFLLVFLRYSRYPLLSMQHAKSGLDIQIVCSNDTAAARSLMAQYREEIPTLVTVYTAFKYLLEIRGLMDVFRGGIGSYSLFYMVVAGIKFGPPSAKDDAAAQLLAVLDFYAEFNTKENWISLNPLEIRPKIEQKPVQSVGEKKALKGRKNIGLRSEDQPYLLCLVDPADATNDLGRKTFGWKHIKATFKALGEKLHQSIEMDDHALFLPLLVGRGFDILDARREKLAAFGFYSSIPKTSLAQTQAELFENQSELYKLTLDGTQQDAETQQEAESQQEAETQQDAETQQEAKPQQEVETQQDAESQQEVVETQQDAETQKDAEPQQEAVETQQEAEPQQEAVGMQQDAESQQEAETQQEAEPQQEAVETQQEAAEGRAAESRG